MSCPSDRQREQTIGNQHEQQEDKGVAEGRTHPETRRNLPRSRQLAVLLPLLLKQVDLVAHPAVVVDRDQLGMPVLERPERFWSGQK